MSVQNGPSKNDQNFDALLKFLQNSNKFRVHTGNVCSWSELKLKTFDNMSEELAECLQLQLVNWRPDAEQFSSGRVDFCLCTNKFCQQPSLKEYNRQDLKITLKAFLSEPSESDDVKQCLKASVSEIDVPFVDQLIVTLPPTVPSASERLLALWPGLEALVLDEHLCAALGTADLDLVDLERVWAGAGRVKPLVNHYSTASSRTLPPELKAFADQKQIVLSTHNDPHPFLTTGQVQELFARRLQMPSELCGQWTAKWAGRTTVMDQRRSVILCKNYIVHFEKRKIL